MARRNISLPDALNAQMDEFPRLNWSRIAQEAFAAAIARAQVAAGKEINMQAAIERLRASKENEDERLKAEGAAAGKAWAAEDAEYHQLEILSTMDFSVEHGARAIAAILSPNTRPEEFWETAIGVDEVGDAFADGFAEAAAEFYDEVRDAL